MFRKGVFHRSAGMMMGVPDAVALAAAALEAWDIGPASLSPLRLKNNWVFAVESPRGRFALRIHRAGYRSPEHTRSELAYLEAFAAATEARVPTPVRTQKGDLVTLTPGDALGRHSDLLAWLDGHPRRPGTRPGLGPSGCRRLGELLGQMHAFSASFAPPYGFDLPRWDADGLFTERSPYRPGPLHAVFRDAASRALFREVETRSRDALAALTALGGREEVGVIHADFILGNVVWRGHEPGLLDFDDCGWGYYAYDLAPLVGNLMDYPAYQRLRAALLDGYRSVRAFESEHEALLEALVVARHATSCLWAAGNARHGGGLSTGEAARHVEYRLEEIRRLVPQ